MLLYYVHCTLSFTIVEIISLQDNTIEPLQPSTSHAINLGAHWKQEADMGGAATNWPKDLVEKWCPTMSFVKMIDTHHWSSQYIKIIYNISSHWLDHNLLQRSLQHVSTSRHFLKAARCDYWIRWATGKRSISKSNHPERPAAERDLHGMGLSFCLDRNGSL